MFVKGTRVEVHGLFFNVPARKKFLKTLRTEAGHIEDVLLAVALTKPALGVKLTVDGKVVLDLPHTILAGGDGNGSGDDVDLAAAARIERVVRCLGKHVRPLLYPVTGQTDLLQLRGYVVAPIETRRDLQGIHLSVNGRPVTDRTLVQAVRAAFRTLLEVGRQPIVALDLAIDKALVDVNVHPRKAEVRFADPRRVSGHLISLLSEFLLTTPWLQHTTPTSTFKMPAASSGLTLAADGSSSSSSSSSSSTTSSSPEPDPAAPAAAESPATLADFHRLKVQQALARFSSRNNGITHAGGTGLTSSNTEATRWAEANPMLPALASAPGRGGATSFAALRVVGQVGGTYLVLEGPEGMVVIDQHAAHERVVFERLKATRRTGALSQPLLLPITVDLGATERAALDDDGVREELIAHGIDVEGYHGKTALVRALPPGLDGRKAAAIVRDALAELADNGRTGALNDRTDAVCARLACHAAIRAGDVMAAVQVRALLDDLDRIDLGAHCPHGRPVVRSVDYGELAGWFDR